MYIANPFLVTKTGFPFVQILTGKPCFHLQGVLQLFVFTDPKWTPMKLLNDVLIPISESCPTKGKNEQFQCNAYFNSLQWLSFHAHEKVNSII